MQSFIKIGGQVSEKNSYRTQRDIHLLLLGLQIEAQHPFTETFQNNLKVDLIRSAPK